MVADDGLGGFHTQWHGEGHNEHVEREYYTVMERRARQ